MLSAIYHVLGITFFFAVYWPGVFVHDKKTKPAEKHSKV